MNPCGEQKLVRVYVSHSRNERLIQQQRFNRAAPLFQSRMERREVDVESVRPSLREFVGERFEELEAAELPDVVEEQQTVVEFEQGARVFVGWSIPEQLARHAEVDVKNSAVEIDEDLLPAAPNTLNGRPGESAFSQRELAAGDTMRPDFGAQDRPALDVRRDRANDGFNFW